MTSTATTISPTTRTARLRLFFAADAVVTGANALIYLAAAGPLADLLGGDAATYRLVGAFLTAYAVLVALYARSGLPSRPGWAIVVANLLWVVASVEVAVVGALGLDGLGRGWVLVQAAVVGAFAVLQARALRAR